MPLPIIDLKHNPSAAELKKIGGCFVPIPEAMQKNLEKIKQASDAFFALPLDIKLQDPKLPDNLEGYLNQSASGYDIERFISRGGMPKNPIMQAVEPALQQTRAFLKNDILMPFLTALLMEANIAEEKYAFHFADFDNTLSIIHYPGQEEQPERLVAHADGALLTVLWAPQPGLEALVNGKWMPTQTPYGHVIVQIGDGLAKWTNHFYKPLIHRVVVKPHTPCTSIASFAVLDNKAPFHNLVTDEEIKPTYSEYLTEHLKNTYKPR